MESNLILPDAGKWSGYYFYTPDDTKHRQEMTLSFGVGIVVGSGVDKIGMFKIKGQYDPEHQEACWEMSYYTHTANYRGFYEDNSIWGVWRIANGASGGFRIWPRQLGRSWLGGIRG